MSKEVALITGGTKGLGKELVAKWLQEGWIVGTCSRSEPEIEALRALGSPENLLAERVDISDPEHCAEFVRKILDRCGRVDCLVNNAGVLGPRTEIVSYPADEWRRVMDINANGPFYMTKAVLPGMLESRSGVIINISSGAGIKGKARWGAYAASKFALEGFTQVLHDEVRDSGVRVHAVDPGAMRSEMRASAYPDEDSASLPDPSRVASVIFDIAAVYEPQLCRLTAQDYM
jgi:NAD(P)-dependent dehydrogenase (short-subunit alcohol dehydrogenase family)